MSQTQSIYIELGGQSVAYSLSYEYQFATVLPPRPFIRSGLEVIPVFLESHRDRIGLAVPLETGLIFGRKKHHFEISTSAIFFREIDEKSRYTNINGPFTGYDEYIIKSVGILWHNRIGYRFQKPQGGNVFRIGFTPVNAYLNPKRKKSNWEFWPWGGICYGISF